MRPWTPHLLLAKIKEDVVGMKGSREMAIKYIGPQAIAAMGPFGIMRFVGSPLLSVTWD